MEVIYILAYGQEIFHHETERSTAAKRTSSSTGPVESSPPSPQTSIYSAVLPSKRAINWNIRLMVWITVCSRSSHYVWYSASHLEDSWTNKHAELLLTAVEVKPPELGSIAQTVCFFLLFTIELRCTLYCIIALILYTAMLVSISAIKINFMMMCPHTHTQPDCRTMVGVDLVYVVLRRFIESLCSSVFLSYKLQMMVLS